MYIYIFLPSSCLSLSADPFSVYISFHYIFVPFPLTLLPLSKPLHICINLPQPLPLYRCISTPRVFRRCICLFTADTLTLSRFPYTCPFAALCHLYSKVNDYLLYRYSLWDEVQLYSISINYFLSKYFSCKMLLYKPLNEDSGTERVWSH